MAADIPLSSGSFVRPYKSPWGSFPIRTVQPISTATINLGQLVTLNYTGSTNAGQVTQSTAAAGPHAFLYGVGFAGSSFTFTSSAVTPPLMSVWEIHPDIEFQAQTKNSSLVSSHIGLHKSLGWDSTLNVHYVDLTDSTAANYRVVITGLISAEGSSGGLCTFRVLASQAQAAYSSLASTIPYLAFY